MIYVLIIILALLYVYLMTKLTMTAYDHYPDKESLKIGRNKIYSMALLVNTVIAVGMAIVEMVVVRL